MERNGPSFMRPGAKPNLSEQPFCAGEYWQPDHVSGPAAFLCPTLLPRRDACCKAGTAMNTHSPLRGRHMVADHPTLRARSKGWIFHKLLDRIDQGILTGAIEVMLPDGTFRILGGAEPGPIAHLTINRWRALARMASSGSIGWFEAFGKGEWESPDAVPLFDVLMRNRAGLGNMTRATGLFRLVSWTRHLRRRNSRSGSKRNIIAHYDLGNDFYKLWLDRTMSYSSALFAEPLNGEESLEAAQKRKISALGKRLKLKPKSSVLEIGCGWGSFARICADKGHAVTAITLSPSQKLWAEQGMAARANPPAFKLCDYRDVTGTYDAIASIEMVEAVGQAYWPTYLDTISRCLKPSGRAAIQYICIADDVFDAYSKTADFIQTHIFPGGMLISESRFRALAEDRGLSWEEPVHFGLHYAETLRRWRIRFDDAVEAGKLPSGFDARFIKLWRTYLMYCEGGFRSGGINVAQVTLVKTFGVKALGAKAFGVKAAAPRR
jgi:cyclopropane-fatty-acyl-phospholipid synthase